MANNIKSKEVIEGFREDFLNIVEEYVQFSTDLRLVKFFIFWNDHHLDYLFANRFDPRELSEAIIRMNELLVEVAADTTSSGFTTIQRVVALYFILCLFVKQPDRSRRAIRLTCDDAICVQTFSNNHQQEYPDLGFVWDELRIKRAIELVEERQLYGPSLLSKRGLKDETNSLSKQTVAANEAVKFLETKIEPQLEEASQIMLPYLEVKESLQLDGIDPTIDLETGIRQLSNNPKERLKDNFLHAKNLINGFKHASTN